MINQRLINEWPQFNQQAPICLKIVSSFKSAEDALVAERFCREKGCLKRFHTKYVGKESLKELRHKLFGERMSFKSSKKLSNQKDPLLDQQLRTRSKLQAAQKPTSKLKFIFELSLHLCYPPSRTQRVELAKRLKSFFSLYFGRINHPE